MNVPNQLTVARFGLTVVFLAILFSEIAFYQSWALVIFMVASLTDYLDGKIARRDNLITDFGKLMDPLADKILTGAAFIAFVGLDRMPAWMVIVFIRLLSDAIHPLGSRTRCIILKVIVFLFSATVSSIQSRSLEQSIKVWTPCFLKQSSAC